MEFREPAPYFIWNNPYPSLYNTKYKLGELGIIPRQVLELLRSYEYSLRLDYGLFLDWFILVAIIVEKL